MFLESFFFFFFGPLGCQIRLLRIEDLQNIRGATPKNSEEYISVPMWMITPLKLGRGGGNESEPPRAAFPHVGAQLYGKNLLVFYVRKPLDIRCESNDRENFERFSFKRSSKL